MTALEFELEPAGGVGERRHGNVSTRGADLLDVMLAFAGLNPVYVDAWIDRYLRGLSLDEIAAAEGVGRGGAHYRVTRANAAIRRYVERREAGRRRRAA